MMLDDVMMMCKKERISDNTRTTTKFEGRRLAVLCGFWVEKFFGASSPIDDVTFFFRLPYGSTSTRTPSTTQRASVNQLVLQEIL